MKASMKMHISNSGRTNLNSKLKNSCGLLSSIFTVEQPFQRYWDKTSSKPLENAMEEYDYVQLIPLTSI